MPGPTPDLTESCSAAAGGPPGPVLTVLGELVVDLLPVPDADAGPEGTAPHYVARPSGNALNVAVVDMFAGQGDAQAIVDAVNDAAAKS